MNQGKFSYQGRQPAGVAPLPAHLLMNSRAVHHLILSRSFRVRGAARQGANWVSGCSAGGWEVEGFWVSEPAAWSQRAQAGMGGSGGCGIPWQPSQNHLRQSLRSEERRVGK